MPIIITKAIKLYYFVYQDFCLKSCSFESSYYSLKTIIINYIKDIIATKTTVIKYQYLVAIIIHY